MYFKNAGELKYIDKYSSSTSESCQILDDKYQKIAANSEISTLIQHSYQNCENWQNQYVCDSYKLYDINREKYQCISGFNIKECDGKTIFVIFALFCCLIFIYQNPNLSLQLFGSHTDNENPYAFINFTINEDTHYIHTIRTLLINNEKIKT